MSSMAIRHEHYNCSGEPNNLSNVVWIYGGRWDSYDFVDLDGGHGFSPVVQKMRCCQIVVATCNFDACLMAIFSFAGVVRIWPDLRKMSFDWKRSLDGLGQTSVVDLMIETNGNREETTIAVKNGMRLDVELDWIGFKCQS
ncbi:hypothetical protein ACLOJK_041255 [Asimina triloba]